MSRRIAAIIRHAEYQQLMDTPSALQPFALTQKGIEQSLQSAADIQSFVQRNNWQLVSNIHTSSLLRAWQTATLFGQQLQDSFSEVVQITSVGALAERSVGSVANLTIKQIEQVVEQDPRFDALPANWKADSHFRLPLIGAESLMQAGSRVAEHITQSMAKLPITDGDQVKLFFGHGAAFRHAAHQLGVMSFHKIAVLSMYHVSPIYIEYFEDGTWQHIAGEWKVRAQQTEYTD